MVQFGVSVDESGRLPLVVRQRLAVEVKDPSTEVGQALYSEIPEQVQAAVQADPNIAQKAANAAAQISAAGVLDIRSPQLNVLMFGAKRDGRIRYGGAMQSGSAVVTCTDGDFTPADVGKRVTVASTTAPYTLAGKILSVESATSLTMDAQASQAVTSGVVTVASDSTAAFTAAVAELPPGGTLFVPAGIYGLTSSITLLENRGIRGEGFEYGVVQRTVSRGSVLLAMASMPSSSLIVMGKAPAPLTEVGNQSSVCEGIAIDAQNLANYPLTLLGSRKRIRYCQFWRGISAALRVLSQNSMVTDCVIGQQSTGVALYVNAGDVKIIDNDIRQGGGHQIHALNSLDLQVHGNHIYGAYSGAVTNTPGSANIFLEFTNAYPNPFCVNITNNLLDGTNGPMVKALIGQGAYLQGLALIGNQILQNTGWPSATYPVFDLEVASGGALLGVVVSGTTGLAGTGGVYTSLVKLTTASATALTHVAVTGNAVLDCARLYEGQRPHAIAGNVIQKTDTSTFNSRSENGGMAQFSGDGTTKEFVIGHELVTTPIGAVVTPGGQGAANSGPFYVTYDGAAVRVFFITAPAAGTDNVKLNWRAWI